MKNYVPKIKIDPWLPTEYPFKASRNPSSHPEIHWVHQLIDSELSLWREDLVRSLFPPYEAAIILGLPVSLTQARDRLVWHFTSSGSYELRSGYYVAKELLASAAPSQAAVPHDDTQARVNRDAIWKLPALGPETSPWVRWNSIFDSL
ncbi:hypothetical protein RCOM_0882000 [Ricinus communis]|uniref:Uncharacterized protein n=1 Tax=Ricinus communis TaxID=3988 RepID=B9SGC2_RICCO|nr:hypothetical protein RCOM_0882000 [Ricinus communis]